MLAITFAVLAGCIGLTQIASAQSVEIADGIRLSTEQTIHIIIVGAIGGLVYSWMGYKNTPLDFDLVKFLNGWISNILIAVPYAIGIALTSPQLDLLEYVMIFFAIIGTTYTARQGFKKSIPSNATDEEIQSILESE